MPYSRLRGEVSRIGSGAAPAWLLRSLQETADVPGTVIRHPLGFLCIPVLRFADGGVCVHVWAPWVRTGRPTTSLTHCHSWDLYSVVLAGELSNRLVRVLAAEPATHRLFDIHSYPDVDEIQATGELVHCRPGAVGFHRAGEVYTMPAGTFHRTDVPGGEATTLMLACGQPGGLDRSIGAIGTPSHMVRRQHCDADEGARVALAVIRLLGQPVAGTTHPDRAATK
jgi:hypothetical protein